MTFQDDEITQILKNEKDKVRLRKILLGLSEREASTLRRKMGTEKDEFCSLDSFLESSKVTIKRINEVEEKALNKLRTKRVRST